MKGIKPTSYLNNMIIYTSRPPAGRSGGLRWDSFPSLRVGARPGHLHRGDAASRPPVPAATSALERGPRSLLSWLPAPLHLLAVGAHRPSLSLPSAGTPRTGLPGLTVMSTSTACVHTACRGDTGTRSGVQATVGAGRGLLCPPLPLPLLGTTGVAAEQRPM